MPLAVGGTQQPSPPDDEAKTQNGEMFTRGDTVIVKTWSSLRGCWQFWKKVSTPSNPCMDVWNILTEADIHGSTSLRREGKSIWRPRKEGAGKYKMHLEDFGRPF